MHKVKRQLQFDNCFVIDPIGTTGGLTTFWNRDLKVTQILNIEFTIEVQIEDSATNLNC